MTATVKDLLSRSEDPMQLYALELINSLEKTAQAFNILQKHLITADDICIEATNHEKWCACLPDDKIESDCDCSDGSSESECIFDEDYKLTAESVFAAAIRLGVMNNPNSAEQGQETLPQS